MNEKIECRCLGCSDEALCDRCLEIAWLESLALLVALGLYPEA
jgi:hypothetical protein